MNLSDLFIVVALGSALYGVIVAVAGRRQFLAKAVNPQRGSWLVASASLLWVGAGLMRWEVQSWDPRDWSEALSQLVTHTPTPPRVKVASVAFLLSLVFLGLVLWCWASLPNDPTTYRRPEDRKAAFRYYVTRLRGGLDYALLACGDGEVLEEVVNVKQVQRRCLHLPRIAPANGEKARARALDDQVASWRAVAASIHAGMAGLDAVIRPGHHGRNHRIVFDADVGGLFFQYFRLPAPGDPADSGLYLFAATLNQAEMNSHTALAHYHLLVEALQHIDRSVRAG
jgi:hypothetical protein